jgi:2,3-bisphosphoglycerate-dependent phosphoglycerate mutase
MLDQSNLPTIYQITLLRHAESEGNLSAVIQGQSDYPLSRSGTEQAKALALEWKSDHIAFDLIISSPLLRASQTAEIIADSLQVPIEFDPTWKERNFGSLQGTNVKDIDQNIDFFHPYQPIGGSGESQLDLFTRAGLALQRLLQQPPGSYLVVSHGGILNKALYVILGITPQCHYDCPIFHFSNIGYAQLLYNPNSLQWAILSLVNPSSLLPQQDQILWNQD